MNTSKYLQSYGYLYVLMLSFKVFQPTKRLHILSFNLLFVLVCIFLYTQLIDHNFCRTGIRSFVTYYNHNTIKRYFDIYMDKGLISLSYSKGNRVYYKLTEQAINIIKDLNSNYDKVLYQFCNKYNIVL